MPNFEKIAELRTHLADLLESRNLKFDMGVGVRLLHSELKAGQSVKVAQLKDTNVCGTVCCLAGETLVHMGPDDLRLKLVPGFADYEDEPIAVMVDWNSVEAESAGILGLSDGEAEWMFFGYWLQGRSMHGGWTKFLLSSPEFTLDRAIQYLDKVLETRKVKVSLALDVPVKY